MTLLLVAVAVFVTAQLGWWLWFQNSYVQQVSQQTRDAWQRDAAAVTELLLLGADPGPLLARYPHLLVTAAGVVVDPESWTAFVEGQERRLRMFSIESAGFVALMVVAFSLMGRRLRVERELKQQQQNFLSAASHELKTPMSSMRLLVETALMRPLTPERQRDYLLQLEGELGRLERLTETVLASTRLEAGSTDPKLEALELGREVEAFLDSNAAGLQARGATISFRAADAPLPVALDRSSLNLILGNLLDNAIKYSPEPEKPIEVALEGRGHLVRLHVTDQGQGIPAAVGNRVFERFYRAGSELVRTAPGVGLGLHLVQATAEDMNGWVSHQPGPGGKGTRFTLTLPRRLGGTMNVDGITGTEGREGSPA